MGTMQVINNCRIKNYCVYIYKYHLLYKINKGWMHSHKNRALLSHKKLY